MWKCITAVMGVGTAVFLTGQLRAAEGKTEFNIGPVQIGVSGRVEASDDLPPAIWRLLQGDATVGAARLQLGVSNDILINDVSKPSVYWLGLRCEQVSPALRAQLNLKEDEGLLVVGVVGDSPAKKAGIEQHDILLKASLPKKSDSQKAGPPPLHSLQDLLQAVDATQEHEMTLTILRAGKERQAKITPAKRPEEIPPEAVPRSDESDWRAFRRWVEGMVPGGEGRPPIRFHVIRPGQIVPPGAAAPVIPDNLTISVTRHGKEPAKITVQQGDKHWEITEKELDKLPADVRPHVDRLLNPLAAAGASVWEDMPGMAMPPTPAMPLNASGAGRPATLHDLQKQLDRQMNDLHRQLDDIRHQLDELRKGKRE